ncbi:hypothetical protein ACG7TL_008318 [Trametes sanguinea]
MGPRESWRPELELVSNAPLNLDPEFLKLCLPTFEDQTINAPVSPTPTPLSNPCRLTNYYPAAYKDFHGFPSNPPCVYKPGPAWRERTGPESHRIIREARPVYEHPLADRWRVIGMSIYNFLDSRDIKWTSIDSVAFAEGGRGEAVLSTPDADYNYPRDGLLQAHGIVEVREVRLPRHLVVNGNKCLHVVKNGLSTGTTVGRVNGPGLDSFTRVHADGNSDVKETGAPSLPPEIPAALSSIVERGGGIVGMLTGGGGATEEADITYVTPYRWLDEQIKKVLPDCYLYDIVQ